jgi:hypothetical protein
VHHASSSYSQKAEGGTLGATTLNVSRIQSMVRISDGSIGSESFVSHGSPYVDASNSGNWHFRLFPINDMAYLLALA